MVLAAPPTVEVGLFGKVFHTGAIPGVCSCLYWLKIGICPAKRLASLSQCCCFCPNPVNYGKGAEGPPIPIFAFIRMGS